MGRTGLADVQTKRLHEKPPTGRQEVLGAEGMCLGGAQGASEFQERVTGHSD